MPFYEYECRGGKETHTFSVFYKTFKEAEVHENHAACHVHKCIGDRIVSMPLQAHLYGNPDGFSKPSPTKRFTYKTVSQKEGNSSSAG